VALARLDISKGIGFLDVGCGTGWAVTEAAKQLRCGKAIGMDISPKMIRAAISQNKTAANVDFIIADSEMIPCSDNSVSSILCSFSLHHYENPLNVLLEMRRVMRPEGRLLIVDSARDVSFPIWIQDRWRRMFEQSHVKYYTTDELRSLLGRANLKLLSPISTEKRFMRLGKFFTGIAFIECTK
jgi:ubiquinone/menaquinone biosynthesis C-methylase UbiE